MNPAMNINGHTGFAHGYHFGHPAGASIDKRTIRLLAIGFCLVFWGSVASAFLIG